MPNMMAGNRRTPNNPHNWARAVEVTAAQLADPFITCYLFLGPEVTSRRSPDRHLRHRQRFADRVLQTDDDREVPETTGALRTCAAERNTSPASRRTGNALPGARTRTRLAQPARSTF